jgi:N,N-dimethylformamidase
VTGPGWTGDIHDWRAAPDQYDAIHFHADDLYDAGWAVAHRLAVPADWASGYYAIRLRAGDDTSYLPLFVRPGPGQPRAPLAFLAATLTTIAYANYRFHLDVDSNEVSLGRAGLLSPEDVLLCESAELGLSTYDLHLDGSPVRHSSRLRPVINTAPGGDVWNLNADTHILAWLDRIGQAFDVITDEDLHREGAALLGQYRAVLTGSHPEYWTTPMWDGLSGYLGRGGRLLYFGGNGFYWRTAMSTAWPGAIEIRRAEGGARYTAEEPGHYHGAFTGELQGLWRRSGRPPNALVGVGSRGIGFDGIGHFRRTDASHDARVAWLFAGVEGPTFGATGLVGCAAGSEIDAADAALGTPAHALVVAASEGHSDAMQPMPEEILMPHPAMSARHDPAIRAEMIFFETAAGGAVLSCGALSWAGAIAADDFTTDVARISTNALRRFLDPRPFPPPARG